MVMVYLGVIDDLSFVCSSSVTMMIIEEQKKSSEFNVDPELQTNLLVAKVLTYFSVFLSSIQDTLCESV